MEMISMIDCLSQTDDSPSPSLQLDLLRLNISGRRFEIQRSTAARYADSTFGLLASSVEDKEQKLRAKDIHLRPKVCSCSIEEWYAERSIPAFELIIDYLSTGRLHCPGSMCKEILKRELAFWRLYRVPLSDCCWDDEDEDVDVQKQAEVKQLSWRLKELTLTPVAPQGSKLSKCLKKTRITLKSIVSNSSTSTAATVFNALSVLFIALAVLNLVISSLPAFQTCIDDDGVETTAPHRLNSTDHSHHSNDSKLANSTAATLQRKRFSNLKFVKSCETNIVFEIVEAVCVGWFTFEWVLRFSLADSKCEFLKSPLNIVDLLAVVPYYVDLVVWIIDSGTSTEHGRIQDFLTVMRIFRALRLFNILRLARYSDSLKLMGTTLWSSRREFGVLIIFIAFTVTTFSSILFFCEKDIEDTEFTSIPASFWWAIVTITTVGYGDMAPKSMPGKILAAICCVGGIIVVAFPVSILVEHFHRLYRTRAKRSPPHRMAIMISPNEVGVIQCRKLANFEKRDDASTKL